MTRKVNSLPDTNAILRYLLKDNPVQFKQAAGYFESVRSGKEKALLLESVLVECVYVLTKFYKVPKEEATGSLAALLRYKGFVNSDKDILLEALTLFAEENVDLADCVLIATARRNSIPMFSFGKKLNKLLTLMREI